MLGVRHADHIWGWSGSHSIKSQPGVITSVRFGQKYSRQAERSPHSTFCLKPKDNFFLSEGNTSRVLNLHMETKIPTKPSSDVIIQIMHPDNRLHVNNRSVSVFNLTLNT